MNSPRWFQYINKGPDERPLGKLGALLQNLFSLPFWWKTTPPAYIVLKLGNIELMFAFPPFISLAIPLKNAHWCSLRAGWRYDKNWDRGDGRKGGYIADVIIKLRMNNKVHF